jgi:hypothetical protein
MNSDQKKNTKQKYLYWNVIKSKECIQLCRQDLPHWYASPSLSDDGATWEVSV